MKEKLKILEAKLSKLDSPASQSECPHHKRVATQMTMAIAEDNNRVDEFLEKLRLHPNMNFDEIITCFYEDDPELEIID